MATTTKANLVSNRFKNLSQIPFIAGQQVFVYKNTDTPATSAVSECTVLEIGTMFKSKMSVLFVVVSSTVSSYNNQRRRKMAGRNIDFIFSTKQEAEDYRLTYRVSYIEKIITEKHEHIKTIQNEIQKLEKELQKIQNVPVTSKIVLKKKSGPFSMLDV